MGQVNSNPFARGHKLASDILSRDSGPDDAKSSTAKGQSRIPHAKIPHSIHIKKQKNGFTVEHTALKDPNKDEYSEGNRKEESNVFSDPTAAHSHIGKLLGVNGD